METIKELSSYDLLNQTLRLHARCWYTGVEQTEREKLKSLTDEVRRRLKYYEDATTRPHPEVPGASDASTSKRDVDNFGDYVE